MGDGVLVVESIGSSRRFAGGGVSMLVMVCDGDSDFELSWSWPSMTPRDRLNPAISVTKLYREVQPCHLRDHASGTSGSGPRNVKGRGSTNPTLQSWGEAAAPIGRLSVYPAQ